METLIDNWIAIATTIAAILLWYKERSMKLANRKANHINALRRMQEVYDEFVSVDKYISENMTTDNFERFQRFYQEEEIPVENSSEKALAPIEKRLHNIRQLIYKSIQ